MPPAAHMRLVRDDEPMLQAEDSAVPADIEDPTNSDEAPDLSHAPVESGEQPDGAIEPLAECDDDAPEPAGEPMPPVNEPALEALLFSTHHPLTAGRLAELLGLDRTRPVRQAIAQLNQAYQATGRAFRIEQVAGGFQLLTLPEHGELLRKLHQREVDAKLTKPALETLAIIAYKQPILRADIEAIRGVACGETIRSLMEKHLVKIAGRAEMPGRPILYGTTRRFLELFGLNSIKDLPQAENGAPASLTPAQG